ncbi:MAG: Stp1/IreP family PP2C-type Ser/Thr phosphatase [Alphaproteobacteria bacterium]|nr:Stp1/IreP family PP2C-type Ser/Thr phosphatase [Alphaproteobacteria bacterium]
MIRHIALTDTGRRRKSNEDAMLADVGHGVFVVADGVGGRAAGEVASKITIETFEEFCLALSEVVQAFADRPEWSTRNAVLEMLDSVCQTASRRVYDEAEANGRRGMTTTLVCAIVGGGSAFLAHVGDSRGYLVRDGLIRQLTEDHSMVNELVRTGQMNRDQALRSRYRNVITRAIGLYPTVQADLMSLEVLPGDRILLSSDGLSDMVDQGRIEAITAENDIETAGRHLIAEALEKGGHDNVTVVMVEPEASPQTEAARARARIMETLFLFEGMPFHVRLRVSRICEELFFVPGQVLVKEGEEGDSMFVIVQGDVSVKRDGVELARLSAGEHFGELALIEPAMPRTASVEGAGFGSAIVVRRSLLKDFAQREPEVGGQLLWRLLATLGERLRNANALAAARLGGGRSGLARPGELGLDDAATEQIDKPLID